MLASLKNLTELNITSTNRPLNLTDDALLVLGKNCKQLRSLRIDYSRSITDDGIFHLCASNAPYGGQCKSIETLSIGGTSVTADGLVMALTNLPNLEILDHQYQLLPALEKFVEINGNSKQLQLKKLSLHVIELNLKSAELEKVCKIIPHVNSAYLHKLENLGVLLNIDAISVFDVTQFHTSLPEFNFFITKFSSSLTSFHINECNIDIDISIFGICPNLEKLKLHWCEILSTKEFKVLPSSVMKLKKLCIVCDLHTKLDAPFLMQLISSPTLRTIEFQCITISEANLYSMIVAAKEHHQVFSNLELFEITNNDQNKFSLEILMQFICVCPKLGHLDVYHCVESDALYRQLKKFAHRNKLSNLTFEEEY